MTVQRKAGENGKMFGGVSSKEIAALIKSQLGYDIDKKKIILKEAVNTLGGVTVNIKLHPKVTAELLLDVVEQK